MKKLKLTLIGLFSIIYGVQSQTLQFEGKEFEIANVKASVTQLNGETVLKVERDLEKIPFDLNRLESTVDEPTFVKVKGLNLENATVEVKVLSRLLPTAPPFARGFIGLGYRINGDNTAYESIYLRPAKAGLRISSEEIIPSNTTATRIINSTDLEKNPTGNMKPMPIWDWKSGSLFGLSFRENQPSCTSMIKSPRLSWLLKCWEAPVQVPLAFGWI